MRVKPRSTASKPHIGRDRCDRRTCSILKCKIQNIWLYGQIQTILVLQIALKLRCDFVRVFSVESRITTKITCLMSYLSFGLFLKKRYTGHKFNLVRELGNRRQ